MINCFNNILSPEPIKEIDIYEYFDLIKNPDNETLALINKARHYRDSKQFLFYQNTKRKLPCFTLNFNFSGRKKNENIKNPTGLIYLDVDNNTNIDLKNPLIFASWISLSGKGRGILVKIDNLTTDNFKENYLAIAKELDIKVDTNAAKPTQFTIHSFDKNIYINNDSTTWAATNNYKNSPITLLLKKEKKDSIEMGEKGSLKFNNIHQLDFKGQDYLVFPEEKKYIAEAYIPEEIKKGDRNNKLASIAFQLKALNPKLTNQEFRNLIHSINRTHCKPPLAEEEAESIIRKILENRNIEPILNKPRRVIFNPKAELTKNEKMKIVNRVTGKARSTKTLNQLEEIIRNWDLKKFGKITQSKLAKIADRNIKTIEKYYKEFKNQIQSKNQSILLKSFKSSPPA